LDEEFLVSGSYSPAATGAFQIFRDIAGGWRWRLRANNNEIVAQSEAYVSEYNARIGAQAVKRIAPGARIE
jgi:uncharacterized protein YegP (UPF0339 family)